MRLHADSESSVGCLVDLDQEAQSDLSCVRAGAGKKNGSPVRSCRRRCNSVSSEVEATAELQRARAAKAGDVAEGSVAHCCGRAGKNCVVQQIEGLDANLELALAMDVEPAKDAGVDIGNAGSTELVAVSVAEALRDDLRRRCSGRVYGG